MDNVIMSGHSLKTTISTEQIKTLERASRRENLGRSWYKFSRNSLSLLGGSLVLVLILLAIFAPIVAPYPKHAGPFTDFAHALIV
jgi:peptide/nickel transport system permease protein